jgi:DNA mismatch endonuclease, patch repair protein
MADIISTSSRSDLMGRVRQKNTDPELRVRKVAHAIGYRFRIHRKDLPGRPDLVFPKYRTAILIHGCFWHRHAGCRRCTSPKSNSVFWSAKFVANINRDRRNISDLKKLGWKVAVIWECEAFNAREIHRKLKRILPGRAHKASGKRSSEREKV